MPDPKLDPLKDKRRKKGTQKKDLVSRLKRVRQSIASLTKRIEGVHKDRRKLASTKDPMAFDGCPVPPVLYMVFKDCRDHGISFGIISADRRDGVAQRFGHSSQKELWDCYQNFLATGRCACGSCNPANAPGHSTHEYRDGPNSYPYGSPDGTALKEPWKLGVDFRSNEECTRFCAAAANLGYHFWQPYNSGSELHHGNCKENPIPNLIKRGRV